MDGNVAHNVADLPAAENAKFGAEQEKEEKRAEADLKGNASGALGPRCIYTLHSPTCHNMSKQDQSS